MLNADINLIAVFGATAAYMIIGMTWYSTGVFGKTWMKLADIKMPKTKADKEKMKQKAMPAMAGSFIAGLIMSYVLAHFVNYFGTTTFIEGAQLGFWIWLGFIATMAVADALYHDTPMQLVYINAGYKLVGLIVMAGILSIWI